MTDTQVTPQPGNARPDTSVPAAAEQPEAPQHVAQAAPSYPAAGYPAARQHDAAAGFPAQQQWAAPPAKPAWHRRRWLRITAISVAAVIALGGAFGAGTLVGRQLGPAGGPAGFSQDGFTQGGPGGMTPPDGSGGFGQAPGSTDDGTTSDGSGA